MEILKSLVRDGAMLVAVYLSILNSRCKVTNAHAKACMGCVFLAPRPGSRFGYETMNFLTFVACWCTETEARKIDFTAKNLTVETGEEFPIYASM